jgi:NADP-reducing hydrogenase subunit HndC
MEELCHYLSSNSLCALGQTAPNPVTSTLKYFRDEYIAHVVDKKCPAGVCKDLQNYEILEDKCVGCTACEKVCPNDAITGSVKKFHQIDKAKCIKCAACVEKCKFDAIIKV